MTKPPAEIPDITIRAMTEDDAAAAQAVRDAKLARWGTLATPYESIGRMRQFMRANAGEPPLVACVASEVVAFGGLHRRRSARRSHVAGPGLSVRDDWQGRGVGGKLFAALIDLADNWLGIRRLELQVYTDNAPAIALYKKFGFAIEGTLRGDAFRDGAFADSYAMARLRGDLPKDNAAAPMRPAAAPVPAFTLRAAEPEDLAAITEIMNQPGVRHGTLSLPYAAPAAHKHLAEPADATERSILAVAGGVVAGIAVLQPGKNRRAHSGYISLLAVRDDFASAGIGRALLAALLDIADNWLNLRRLSLDVMADNASAIRLYQSFGFAEEVRKQADVFRAGGFADGLTMARWHPSPSRGREEADGSPR